MPRLLAAARDRAPQASFPVRGLDVDHADDLLGRGEIDAFVATPILQTHRMVRLPLFQERYVAMLNTGHPRIKAATVALDQLRQERLVSVIGPIGHVAPRTALAHHGLLDRVTVEVERVAALPYILEANRDLVTIVPEYVAEVLSRSHPVRAVHLPFDVEPIEVAVYARHASSRTPAQRWFVDFLVEVLSARVSSAQRPSSNTQPSRD